MSACESKYVGKNCMCMPDPIYPEKTMCGYLDRDSGSLYACSTGCCGRACPDQNLNVRLNVEYARSEGISLPQGFGQNMVYGTTDWEPPGSSVFTTPPSSKEPPLNQLIIMGALLVVILVTAILT